jgi:hypothetical protein
MGRRRASGLTARQREWLAHLRKAGDAGETVRGYARRRGLSEHALYQAAKELRKKGVVVGPSRRPAKVPAGPGAAAARAGFVEVRAKEPPAIEGAPGAWRARLPNGVVIEGSGELSAALVALAGL